MLTRRIFGSPEERVMMNSERAVALLLRCGGGVGESECVFTD